ncbi:recombinase family protein [Streptomyces sp. NPDC006235]|uniref:recombinase family protein n=1 Tax=Streptomyces sp. NPDC006235 TaxID=3156736 RepID=UPI0033B709EA
MTQSTALAVLYAYLRLSRENEGSASIETQRSAYLAWMDGAEFKRWLAEHGLTRDQVEVVEYIDSGVSGAKPLEERKDMRRLMRDLERSRRTDRPTQPIRRMLVAWKLDRYARSVSEFLRLIAWAEGHGARLATTDNTINTATPTGRMVAVVLAALAQWERDMIASRIKEGHATRRSQGRWTSGRAPFPYRIYRRDGAAYLEPDPDKSARAYAGVLALITGGTVAGTAPLVGLSEPQWRRLLKSPTLRGQRAHKGKLVLSEDGITPVQFAEPIISAAEAKAIVQRLNALATGEDRAPRGETPQCAGMAWCYKCAGKLNGGTSDQGNKLYRCKAGHVTIYAETLDNAVEADFLKRWGGMAEYVVRLEGGNDLSNEMEEAKEQAQRIATQMAEAGPLMLGMLNEKAAELEATYAALRAAHDPDVREVLEPTGRTLREAWEADEAARAGLLADLGLHVVLWPHKGEHAREERLEITWVVGGDDQDLIEQLSEAEAAK